MKALRRSLSFLVAAVLLAIPTITPAQQPMRHVKLVREANPTGPNQSFFIRLVMVEHDVDLASYEFEVAYHNSQCSLIAIHDNLGVGGLGAGAAFHFYTGEKPTTKAPYVNVYRVMAMETAGDVHAPLNPADDFNLGRLEFKTSPTYDPASGPCAIHASDKFPGASFYSGLFEPLPITYINLPPPAAVADWTVY